MLRSYIVGYDFTYADIAIWGTLRGNRAAYGFIKKDHLINVGRWFRFVEESWPWVTEVVDEFSVQIKERKAVKAREGASYEIALPETEKGVVTRFPPEPSSVLVTFPSSPFILSLPDLLTTDQGDIFIWATPRPPFSTTTLPMESTMAL